MTLALLILFVVIFFSAISKLFFGARDKRKTIKHSDYDSNIIFNSHAMSKENEPTLNKIYNHRMYENLKQKNQRQKRKQKHHINKY